MRTVGPWLSVALSGLLAVSGLLALRPAAAGKPRTPTPDGADLIGRPAPPWEVSEWLQSPPLSLADLKGKVVLVRWFMSTSCPL